MVGVLKKTKAILTPREIRNLFFLGAGSLVLSLAEAFSIGIIIPIIGLFMSPERIQQSAALRWLSQATGARDYMTFLVILMAVAFALFIFKFFYSAAMLYQQQNILGGIYNRLTSQALDSYLGRPYSFHLTNNSSVMFKNVMLEASHFVYYFLNPVILVVSEAVILLGICALLFAVYPLPMLLLTGSFGFIAVVVNGIFKKRIKAYALARRVCSEGMYKAALDSLGAVKEIKMYDTPGFFVSRYLDVTRRYTDSYMKFMVISGLPRYIFEVVLFTFILGAILLGASFHRTAAELVPMLTVIGVASLRLLPSFSKIYSNLNLFHYSMNSFDVMNDIFARGKDDRVASPTAKGGASAPRRSLICVDNITFGYDPSDRPILKDLSLDVLPGQTAAFVGRTGSGKSTLIDVMMGLLAPSGGNLFYRQLPIGRHNVGEYRKKIGYVPQNIFLTDDSIMANIAFGVPLSQIDRGRVKDVIRTAQLESFIGELPEGLDTHVGERGVRISGGQKQRIGIARALYRAPEILVLDESTSALDGYTEAKLYAAIREMSKNMTIIIVTHRLATLERCDVIHVIDRGTIVDSGNFRDVSEMSPVFQDMARQKAIVGAGEVEPITRSEE